MPTTRSNDNDSSVNSPPIAQARRPWWLLPLLLGLVLVAIVLFKGFGIRGDSSVSRVQKASDIELPTAERVSIRIDYSGERAEKSSDVPWFAGMTVRDLVASASVGDVREQGSGASAFLTEINGLKNEGADGRNWMYSVNGQRGDRSFAIYELQPGDHVLWNFAPPQ